MDLADERERARSKKREARSKKREARSEKRAPQVVAGALSRHASLANHRPRKFAGVGRCAVAMLAGVGVLRHHGWLGHGATLYLRATATPCWLLVCESPDPDPDPGLEGAEIVSVSATLVWLWRGRVVCHRSEHEAGQGWGGAVGWSRSRDDDGRWFVNEQARSLADDDMAACMRHVCQRLAPRTLCGSCVVVTRLACCLWMVFLSLERCRVCLCA